MYKIQDTGWIEVIAGPMFSGKSTELIRRLERSEIAGEKTIAFKPTTDTRSADNYIEDRNGGKVKAIRVEDTDDLIDKLPIKVIPMADSRAKDVNLAKIEHLDFDVIAIDEVQFMDNKIIKLCDKLANSGKRVIVSGLDLDFMGDKFEIISDLISKAEYIDIIKAVCSYCGNPASYTQKYIDGKPVTDGERIEVGDSEKYKAVCRKCFEVKEEIGRKAVSDKDNMRFVLNLKEVL